MSNQSNVDTQSEKGEAKSFRGFAVAASFGGWGSIFWLAPIYVGFSGFWQLFCYGLGGICAAISLLGALQELSQLLGTEMLSWWGVALVFLVPGGLLHYAAYSYTPASPWLEILKISALSFDAIGLPFIFFGIAILFDEAARPKPPEQEPASRKNTARTVLAFASALLPPIVAGIADAILT